MPDQATDTTASTHPYWTHPLLDPHLPRRQPAIAKLWLSTYKRIKNQPDDYRRMVRASTLPPGAGDLAAATLDPHFPDADAYLDDLLRLVPERIAKHLAPREGTREACNMLELLQRTFEDSDPRSRYEAQRKLYLTKLLFDVDHCRSIIDGPRHQQRFDSLIDSSIWSKTGRAKPVDICCLLTANGRAKIRKGPPKDENETCWNFQLKTLPEEDGAAINIYHYQSRFKYEATSQISASDGRQRLVASPRWPGLGRRSGSIVSKMIRRGIANPNMVQDVLGAMFIVGSSSQAYALERRLVHNLGGPWSWRNRIDTLSNSREGLQLGPSSSGFRVLKSIVDILNSDNQTGCPYLFSVEIQIFPIEEYLVTLNDTHYASHSAYKRRQFLNELLPILFPAEIFGSELSELPG